MTRQDLVKKAAAESDLTRAQVSDLLDAFINAVVECYRNNERVDLKLFGSFIPKTRKARKARNLQTGEEIEIPEHKVLTFKPSSRIDD